jgi:CDGSH-type Zn-finger protein
MEGTVVHPLFQSKVFADGGIYVMRSQRLYIVVVCHQIGVNGIGPHKHNDWLSFELCVDGQPVIIDPGTYCYTGNIKQRRIFRSTAYHNTVIVDGEEQIPIDNCSFSLNCPYGRVKILRWESDAQHDLLEAEHNGYCRLPHPVVYRRRFFLDKIKDAMEITDSFSGNGRHTLEWCMHMNIGLKCQVINHIVQVYKGKQPFLKITYPEWEPIIQRKAGWISKAYNRREESEKINWRYRGQITNALRFIQRFDTFDASAFNILPKIDEL